MKKMKQIYTLLAVITVLFSSCSKDFLDKKPLDKLSEDDVFANAALLEAHINSMYVVLPDPLTEGNIACITDEAFFRFGGTSTNYIARGLMTADNVIYMSEGGAAHNSRTTFLNIWNRAYSHIRNMNDALAKIDASDKIPASDLTRLKGELYFLRAWAYSNLVQRYGGVPIIKEAMDINSTFDKKRDNFDDCIDFILSDLAQAKALLPAKAATLGRVSRDACLALESRITLIAASPLFNDPTDAQGSVFKGKYSKDKWTRALNAAKAICDRADLEGAYSLGAYEDTWTNINCSEVIWAKYFSTTAGNKAQLLYAPVYFNGWTSCEPSEAVVLDYEMAATGKKFFEEGSGYDPTHPWAGRDPRFYKTIIYPDCIFRDSVYNNHYYVDATGKRTARGRFWRNESDDTGYNLRKWHIETASVSESENSTLMFPWLRLAEMYLNYAEAAYNCGNEALCRQYLNKVRSRTGVNMPAVTESGANLFDRIVNERRVELAFEPFRYFDLRRWKIADFYENIYLMGTGVLEFPDGTLDFRIAEIKNNNPKRSYAAPWAYSDKISYTYTWLGKSYTIDYGHCHSMMGVQKAFHDQHHLMPIPSNEVIKSENALVQNPGY